jgi:uncharacterized protein YlaI
MLPRIFHAFHHRYDFLEQNRMLKKTSDRFSFAKFKIYPIKNLQINVATYFSRFSSPLRLPRTKPNVKKKTSDRFSFAKFKIYPIKKAQLPRFSTLFITERISPRKQKNKAKTDPRKLKLRTVQHGKSLTGSTHVEDLPYP